MGPQGLDDKEKVVLKALVMAIVIGQTAGALGGLARAQQTKKRSQDVKLVAQYADEILAQAGA